MSHPLSPPPPAANLLTLLVNGLELCDPLGDKSVWGSVFELTSDRLEHGSIMLTTKVSSDTIHYTCMYMYITFDTTYQLEEWRLLVELKIFPNKYDVCCAYHCHCWLHLLCHSLSAAITVFPPFSLCCNYCVSTIFSLAGPSWTALPSSPTCPGGPTMSWQVWPRSWLCWRFSAPSREV